MNLKTRFDGFLKSDLASLGIVLFLSSAACALFILVRFALTAKFHYSFLLWNLFLAWVPFFIASFLYLYTKGDPDARAGGKGKAILIGGGLLWLLFYPNAPYIFTDIIHLITGNFAKVGNETLGLESFLWYDLVLTATFAFTGHFIGLVSMYLVNEAFEKRIGKAAANAILSFAALIAGIGVYLGRFVRLNSWDLIVNPGEALADINKYLLTPKGLLFSLAFGFFIFVSYHAFRSFKKLGV
jgi:uncharacterized membrane protein